MDILLTGGTGYIGSHTTVTLAKSLSTLISDKPHHIILFDNLSNSDFATFERIQEIIPAEPALVKNTSITFIQGDI